MHARIVVTCRQLPGFFHTLFHLDHLPFDGPTRHLRSALGYFPEEQGECHGTFSSVSLRICEVLSAEGVLVVMKAPSLSGIEGLHHEPAFWVLTGLMPCYQAYKAMPDLATLGVAFGYSFVIKSASLMSRTLRHAPLPTKNGTGHMDC